MTARCRVAVTWKCGRHGRTWSDALRPCPACGSQRVIAVRFAGRGEIATMEPTETGTLVTFEDGTTAILGFFPQEVS